MRPLSVLLLRRAQDDLVRETHRADLSGYVVLLRLRQRGHQELANEVEVIQFRAPPFGDAPDPTERPVSMIVEPTLRMPCRVGTHLGVGSCQLIAKNRPGSGIQAEVDDV